MDQEQNPMHSAPQLCGNHCGFYGSPSFDGLCSKCHKDSAKSQTDKTQQGQPAGSGAPLSQVLHETSALLAASTSTSTAQPTVSVLPATSSSVSTSVSTTSVSASSAATTATTATAAASAAPQPDTQVSVEPDPGRTPAGLETSPAADSPADPAEPAAKKKKSRCDVCRKKVGLTGFTCRCDGLFCSLHRYSDKHDCSFDYRVHGQQQIRKNNPVIVGEKVNKI